MARAVRDNLTADPYPLPQRTKANRDAETDTDHAQFRQYYNTWARWMSPDPYNGSYDITNPQSFNRYAYVNSNPLVSVDPSGRYLVSNCVS
ncbi:MAG: RHS repeat-associated core domain-containing protein [Acidobacteriaceae bacterium]